jgi:transposase
VLAVQVLDNAPVHVSEDTLPLLVACLDMIGVRVVFLPKYSPELNPAELIFAQAKRYLREHRRAGESFFDEILEGFSRVSRSNVAKFYDKCLYRYDED